MMYLIGIVVVGVGIFDLAINAIIQTEGPYQEDYHAGESTWEEEYELSENQP